MKELYLVKHISSPELCSIHRGIMQRFPIWNRVCVCETLSCGRSWKTFHVANTKGCLPSNVFAICTTEAWIKSCTSDKWHSCLWRPVLTPWNVKKTWNTSCCFNPRLPSTNLDSDHPTFLSLNRQPLAGVPMVVKNGRITLYCCLYGASPCQDQSAPSPQGMDFLDWKLDFFGTTKKKKTTFQGKHKENGWSRKETIELGSGALMENEWLITPF